MNSYTRDILWFLAELGLFIVLVPIWVPLLILSLGYSLLCPHAYKPAKESGAEKE